jgi:group II intron reverse transcriptase/maturase
VRQVARQDKDVRFTALLHHVDVDRLRAAYQALKPRAAPGVDGVTWGEYGLDLEDNLRDLHARVHRGSYRAKPSRRVFIPKPDGRQRPLGVAALEDKILQRAVVMALEPIYEQDFLPCSYGFRPGRSAHQALQALWQQVMALGGCWLVEVDIRKFFDTLDHAQLRLLLRRRLRVGVLLRLIDKWLKAGVLEGGELTYPEAGTPQGGVISPLLANIYLHYVLDEWFEQAVMPRLKGRAFLVRYADDFVMGFACEEDARRVLAVLPKRFGKYGLTIHPAKTRLLPFIRPDRSPSPAGVPSGPRSESFDFLGFTHFWSRSKLGRWVVKRKTAGSRFRRAVQRIGAWCRLNRHLPLGEQHRTLWQKLRGHFQYYGGVIGNGRCLWCFRKRVQVVWRKWLARRGGLASWSWARMTSVLGRFVLPTPPGWVSPCAVNP